MNASLIVRTQRTDPIDWNKIDPVPLRTQKAKAESPRRYPLCAMPHGRRAGSTGMLKCVENYAHR